MTTQDLETFRARYASAPECDAGVLLAEVDRLQVEATIDTERMSRFLTRAADVIEARTRERDAWRRRAEAAERRLAK